MSSPPQVPLHCHSVDVRYWPVLITRATDGGDAEMYRQMDVLREIHRTHPEPYVNVIDTRNGSPPSAKQRRAIARFGDEERWHSERYCLGVAFVITNPLMRGAFTAIMWLHKHDRPRRRVFATLDEAVAWGQSMLDNADLILERRMRLSE